MNNTRITALAAISLWSLAVATPALARATQPVDVGQVVVTATALARPEAPDTVVIDRTAIDARGARTLDEALRAIPGLQVSSGAQGIPRIMLRGLPPRETPIFLNGVPLNPSGDAQFDPSLVPAENIQSISVIEGTSSVLYGPNAGAGVIDIETRSGAQGLRATGSAEYGTDNAQRYALTVSGAQGASDLFLGASSTSQDGFRQWGGGKRTNSDLARRSLLGTVGTSLSGWRVSATASYVEGDQGLPPGLYTAQENPFAAAQRFERLEKIAGHSLQLALSSPAGSRFTVRASGYANWLAYSDRRYDNADYDSMSDATVQSMDERLRSRVDGGRLQLGYDAGALGALTIGVEAQQATEEISGRIRDVAVTAASASGTGSGKGTGTGGGTGTGAGSAGTTTSYSFRALDEDHDLTTVSVAMEYRVAPWSGGRITAGYSHHWFARPGDDNGGDQFVGGIRQRLVGALDAYGSVARKISFPTIDQLYDPSQGNANLTPERALQWEAGVAWQPQGGLRVQLGGFGDRIDGFVQNDKTTQHYVNSNISERGIELIGRAVIAKQFSVQAGYTYLDARQADDHTPVDYRPRHVFVLAANWTSRAGWFVSSDASYRLGETVGERSDTTVRTDLSDAVVAALKLGKTVERLGAQIYVRGTNLIRRPRLLRRRRPGTRASLLRWSYQNDLRSGTDAHADKAAGRLARICDWPYS